MLIKASRCSPMNTSLEEKSKSTVLDKRFKLTMIIELDGSPSWLSRVTESATLKVSLIMSVYIKGLECSCQWLKISSSSQSQAGMSTNSSIWMPTRQHLWSPWSYLRASDISGPSLSLGFLAQHQINWWWTRRRILTTSVKFLKSHSNGLTQQLHSVINTMDWKRKLLINGFKLATLMKLINSSTATFCHSTLSNQ